MSKNAHLGMSDWCNWLERTSPLREVMSSNPGRNTCLVQKFSNPSFLGGQIDKDLLEGTPCSAQSLILIYYTANIQVIKHTTFMRAPVSAVVQWYL